MLERTKLLVAAAAVAVASALAAAGCGSDPDGILAAEGGPNGGTSSSIDPTSAGGAEIEQTATGLPCPVVEVLKARCQTCHSSPTKFGASTPLVTWDDLQKPGPGANANKKVYELVKERIHDDARPMPQSPDPRLDAKELAALDTWIDAGAKPSKDVCSAPKASDGVKPLSCKPDTVLVAKKPFEVKPGGLDDETICFGFDQVLTKKRHITALAPKIDNAQLVHHILVFQTDLPVSSEPTPCSVYGTLGWRLIAGWAPGGNNLELPAEAGLPAEQGTTHWAVQIHYNKASAKQGVDQSGYALCTTEDLRPNDAGVIGFGGITFAIPPRATHSIQCNYAVGLELAGATLFNASPHMHKLGAAMSTERIPLGTGAPEPVFSQKDFTFEAQSNHPIDAKLALGDIVRTHCTWKNTGDSIVTFGEATDNEMCFDFVGYYPKVPSPAFSWITPSLAAVCAPEL